MPQRILIIGAGVMGCAVGRELALAGCDVTLLEKAIPGAEASSAAAGILGAQSETDGPGVFLDLCLRSRALWPQFARDLQQESDVAIGYLNRGLLEVFTEDAGAERAETRARWMHDAGLRASLLTRAEALALEPALGPAVRGALHVPDDGSVEPPCLARALAVAAARAGVKFRENAQVQRVVIEDGAVRGVLLADALLRADAVVVAAGAWTDLLPGLAARRTAIEPVHGQLIMLDTRRPILQRTLATHGGYIVPRADGRVVVGATTETTGFRKQVTAGGLQRVLGVALDLVPALAEAAVLQHWSGLRPFAVDGLPLLGAHEWVLGLHFATGHHRNGILLAPVTARVVADAVLGRAPGMDLRPFRP